jgi:hypothetical protein
MARLTLRSRLNYLKVHRPDTKQKTGIRPHSFAFSNPRHYVLPYLRSSLTVIAVFLIARLLLAQTLEAAAPPPMPYQRGQFWVRRFRAQAQALCAALAALTQPTPAPDFVHRALAMLESTGWIVAHRFLFAGVRCHLLGWPLGLAPDGRRAAFSSSAAPA